jgi:hypothetical protein
MQAGDDGNRRAAGPRGGCLLDGVLGLLGAAWALGTPVLAFAAMFASAPFLGEQPTAAETAQSHRMLLGALACGILVPLVGAVLGLGSGRKLAAVVFAAALGISLLAAAATGFLSRDSLRTFRDELLPPTSTSVPRPVPCQEHSGGDNRCPGG